MFSYMTSIYQVKVIEFRSNKRFFYVYSVKWEKNKITKYLMRSTKIKDPITRFKINPHQTFTFAESRTYSTISFGFSDLHIRLLFLLTQPAMWNAASSVNKIRFQITVIAINFTEHNICEFSMYCTFFGLISCRNCTLRACSLKCLCNTF